MGYVEERVTFFTFQSGSIQIPPTPAPTAVPTPFTFQSGSIQMRSLLLPLLCLVAFTFQSGSIQIVFGLAST